jgi:peptidoglycan/LPS O-acetylase OafA/YrhL
MAAQADFAEASGQDKGGSLDAGAAAVQVPRLHLAYLDGLRAVAAFYVVLFHALLGLSQSALVGPWRVLRRVFAYGHEAVAIFIVLSGFCLMLPVVRSQPERLEVELGKFVGRRAFRILPPYFAALAGSIALLVVFPILRTPGSGTIWDNTLPGLEVGAIASHLLLIHNWSSAWGYQINGPLWSVATEWQIYFCFPLLLLPAWRRLGMVGTLAVAAAFGYAPLLFAPTQAGVAIPWYLLLFALGMAAAAIAFSRQALPARLRARLRWRPLCNALWLTCLLLSSAGARLWFGLKPLADLLVGLASAALLISLSAQAVSGARGRLLDWLESRPLVALGHFSYSLYLTHLPVLALCYFALRPLHWPPIASMLALALLGVPASLLVAYAFHLGVERRFIRVR